MIARLSVFCRERFPLVPSALGAALLAACADLCGQRFVGQGAVVVDGSTAASALLVFLGFFLVRAVDELRDLPGDRRAHPERPLVRGAVRVADVVVAAVASAAAAVVVGACAGAGVATAVVFAATLVLQLDGGLRALARRPLLSLLAHQLIVPLWVLLVVVVRSLPVDGRAALLALLAASLSLLFEVGRKVHHSDDENRDDDSYSQLFGTRPASLLAAGLAAVTGLLAVAVGVLAALPAWTVFCAVVGAVSTGVVFAAFAAAPTRGQSRRLGAAAALTSLFVYLPLVSGALLGGTQ